MSVHRPALVAAVLLAGTLAGAAPPGFAATPRPLDLRGARIYTVAGAGSATAVAGMPVGDARITPAAALVLANGDLVIADARRDRIWRVGDDGRLRPLAGDGTSGFRGDGGPATAARLRLEAPMGLVAYRGGVAFSDAGNQRVRLVGPDGRIATIAGTGAPGYLGDGGPATAAQLDDPGQLAVAPSGDLLIAAGVVRRVDAAGMISTALGSDGCADVAGQRPPNLALPALTAGGTATVSLAWSRPDGSLGIAGRGCLWSAAPGGQLELVAGGGSLRLDDAFRGNVVGRALPDVFAVTALPDGGFAFTGEAWPSQRHYVWRVAPGGEAVAVAGCVSSCRDAAALDGSPALSVPLSYTGLASLADGRLLLLVDHDVVRLDPDGVARRIRRITAFRSASRSGPLGLLTLEQCTETTCAAPPGTGLGAGTRIVSTDADGTVTGLAGGGTTLLAPGVAPGEALFAANAAAQTPDGAVWWITEGTVLWRADPGGVAVRVAEVPSTCVTDLCNALVPLADGAVALNSGASILRIDRDGSTQALVTAGFTVPSADPARLLAGGAGRVLTGEWQGNGNRVIIRRLDPAVSGDQRSSAIGEPRALALDPTGAAIVADAGRLWRWPSSAVRPVVLARDLGGRDDDDAERHRFFPGDAGGPVLTAAGSWDAARLREITGLQALADGSLLLVDGTRVRVLTAGTSAPLPAVAIARDTLRPALRGRLVIHATAPGRLTVEAFHGRRRTARRTHTVAAGATTIAMPGSTRAGVQRVRLTLRTRTGRTVRTERRMTFGGRLSEEAARAALGLARARSADDDGSGGPETTSVDRGCRRLGARRIDCVQGGVETERPSAGWCEVDAARLGTDGVIYRTTYGHVDTPCRRGDLRRRVHPAHRVPSTYEAGAL